MQWNKKSDNLFLDEIDKLVFKGKLNYYNFQINAMGALIHPENYKLMKETEYLVENNLPVPRKSLYILMPDMFVYSEDDLKKIAELKQEETLQILGYVY